MTEKNTGRSLDDIVDGTTNTHEIQIEFIRPEKQVTLKERLEWCKEYLLSHFFLLPCFRSSQYNKPLYKKVSQHNPDAKQY